MAPEVSIPVSVVIVSWNSAEHLLRCLQSLQAQVFRDFEVILVDNASRQPETRGMTARFPDLHIRTRRLGRNIGYAAAANVGARMARGVWVAMLNPDAFPDPGWLQELVLATEEYPRAFFASRQIQADRPMLLDGEGDVYYVSGLALRANYNLPHFGPGAPREVFSACAAAALYPRKEFLQAGGFDEDYFAYSEDVDLGFRLRLMGLRCYLVQAASVRHVGSASSGRRSDFAVYHGHRNLVWTYVTDMPAPWIWLYLPLHLAVNLASVLYFLVTGHGGAILRAKFDALRGLRRAIAKRRIVQRSRLVPAADVVGCMNANLLGPLEGWISRQWPPVGS